MRQVKVKPVALKAMLEHGKSQLESGLEVGGVITGREENGSVLITHAIPLSIGQKTTVEITPELFTEAYNEKEKVGIEDPIIGWYHSHPGYSCFMSAMDEKAHRKLLNLYRDAIALVLDPVLYTDRKPSSEYFKVFTLSDGKVTEIPSDIDVSPESKDEMFRGFVSGKETVIERVVVKPPEGRSWTQIASVALLALILAVGIIGYLELNETASSAKEINKEIHSIVGDINGQITAMNNRLGNLVKGIEKIDEKVEAIEEMVKEYDFEFEVPQILNYHLGEDISFKIEIKNTGNTDNEYSVEITGFPDWFVDRPQIHLDQGETETVTISAPQSFNPSRLTTPVTIRVTDSVENSKKQVIGITVKPRVTFTINEPELEPYSFAENTFNYSCQMKLEEKEHSLEIENLDDTKTFSISYSFGDPAPEIDIIVETFSLSPKKKVILTIPKVTEDTESFTLTITVKDEKSGETYILVLTFE